MYVIKGFGFSSIGCSLIPTECSGEELMLVAKQNLIIDQLSNCRRNLSHAGQIAC